MEKAWNLNSPYLKYNVEKKFYNILEEKHI